MTLRPNSSGPRGLSLVETVMSVMIVGGMLAAALNAAGAARIGAHKSGDRAKGALLAQDLMSEILTQPYHDPDQESANLGNDTGEPFAGNRILFDDVDDYNTWDASPPQKQDGTVMSNLAGWRRRVTVAYGNPSDLKAAAVDTGILLIVVTVTHNDVETAKWTAIRTLAYDTMIGS